MVDIMAFQSLIASLKTAGNLAKSLIGLQSTAEINAKVIEFQDLLMTAQTSALTAQSEQATMVQKISDLEEEITHIKAWEMEKQRYQLISPWDGCHVYALKQLSKGTEPPHWICAQCYEDGRKSILQNARRFARRRFDTIRCSRCKLELDSHGNSDRLYVTD